MGVVGLRVGWLEAGKGTWEEGGWVSGRRGTRKQGWWKVAGIWGAGTHPHQDEGGAKWGGVSGWHLEADDDQ